MAAMYAVYHGPEGLRRIGRRVHGYTQIVKSSAEHWGYKSINQEFFDTLVLDASSIAGGAQTVHAAASAVGVNLRQIDDRRVGVTVDESVGPRDIVRLVNIFASASSAPSVTLQDLRPVDPLSIPPALKRTTKYLPHPVFNTHHSETEMLRYIYHLQSKDLGLVHAMIPLGSCTMKLNSTTSMLPITWPEFSAIHPFAPSDQVKGYMEMIKVFVFDNYLSQP
jgi:glycine dehydrogenase